MRRGRLSGAVCALGALALTLVSCRPEASAGRVVVLGIDGLPTALLDQLVTAGKLPNFGRLYREGAAGRVSVLEAGLPPFSAGIWTSFATGALPADHGVVAFTRPGPDGRPEIFPADARRVPALWAIASAGGKRVGVVNWPFSYPAEAVNGFMITDRYLPLQGEFVARSAGVAYERRPDRVIHPPGLATTVARVPLRRREAVARTAALAEDIDRDVLEVTYAALAAEPVDLLLTYTNSLDPLSHIRWNTHEPRPGDAAAADEVVAYVQRYDVLLGELLGRLGPADHLVVISDHGMERNPEPDGLPGVHLSASTAFGVLMLHGPRVQAGARVWAHLLDVAPTVLDLAGVPPPAGMGGRVLVEAFRPGYAPLRGVRSRSGASPPGRSWGPCGPSADGFSAAGRCGSAPRIRGAAPRPLAGARAVPKKVVVIPTYNERDNVRALVPKVLGQDPEIDVVVVDDRSPDGTGEVVEALGRENGRVHLVSRARREGLGPAYKSGFAWALANGAELIVQMDADFSHAPEMLPHFFEAIADCDLVLGSRYSKGITVVNWPIERLLISYFGNWYVRRLTGLPVRDATGGFKCWRRAALEAVDMSRVRSNGYAFQIEMTFRAWRRRLRLKEIPIIFVDRTVGDSKMSPRISLEALWIVWWLRLRDMMGRL